MKKIFFSALALALMASCSQNEITDDGQQAQVPISFAPQFGNSVHSRATTNLGTGITLGVYAYNGATPAIYDGITNLPLAYTTTPSTGWYLTPAEHYYPNDDSDVSFWAYGPKDDARLSAITCPAATGPAFTLTLADTDKTTDIMATQTVQTGKKSTATTAPIAFAMKRVLAQIAFKAQVDNATNQGLFDVKIYSVTIAAKGTANYTNKTWGTTHSGDVTWNVITSEQSVLTDTPTALGSAVNIIPEQAVTITVKAKVYKKGGSVVIADQTATLTLDGTIGKEKPVQGNSYTYTVKVTPNVGLITFGTPTVDDWTPKSSDLPMN